MGRRTFGRISGLLAGVAIGAVLLSPAGCSVLGGDDGGDASPTTADLVPTGNPNGHDDGGQCNEGHDCKSGVCTGNACAAPTHSDGVKNGDETGLDCGGPTAPKCGQGQKCNVAADCTSGECKDGACGAPRPCNAGSECGSGVCTGGVCQSPTSSDGVKNADESDVDCGGTQTNAPRCATGKACAGGKDCDSQVCKGGKCQAPSGDDGVKNGDESDVDCGGTTTNAPRCATGKACSAHADCASDGCDETKHCAVGRSCTQLDGGRTCGVGEVTDATKQHESCCETLAIPGRTTRLDKYKVTAGRMRAFIERVNGNVLAWYQANKASLSPAARAQIEPYTQYLPQDRTSAPYGSDLQLGGTIYLTDRPSPVQGCFVGSAAQQGYGSHTFWNGTLEGDDRGFEQKFLDRLPLNCSPYPLAAAFCAWDGGRLQTFDENNAAYGANPYPWGATPAAGGYASVNGSWTVVGPATGNGFSRTPCPTCDPDRLNWQNNYQVPAGGNAQKPWDYAYWISPPGRFPKDAGPGGHRDIAGLMMELTATVNGTDAKYNQPMVRWSRAGSWEGHPVNYGQYSFAIMTKYGKVGLRCAHD